MALLTLNFIKYQATGNDFILVDRISDPVPIEQVRSNAERLCDRHFGIGADQILVVSPHAELDAAIEFINADGSSAEMCGNGLRAIGLHLRNRSGSGRSGFSVETARGRQRIEASGDGFRVQMGTPEVSTADEKLEIEDTVWSFTRASIGNPHAVLFSDAVDSVPLEKIGPRIERHPTFPHGTNVEFMERISEQHFKMRVWERGAGVTLSCGSGACASAAVAILRGRASSPLKIDVPGGELQLEWQGPREPIFLSGRTELVFEGTTTLL